MSALAGSQTSFSLLSGVRAILSVLGGLAFAWLVGAKLLSRLRIP